MPHTFTNVLIHTIFSARERAPLIADPIRAGSMGSTSMNGTFGNSSFARYAGLRP